MTLAVGVQSVHTVCMNMLIVLLAALLGPLLPTLPMAWIRTYKWAGEHRVKGYRVDQGDCFTFIFIVLGLRFAYRLGWKRA